MVNYKLYLIIGLLAGCFILPANLKGQTLEKKFEHLMYNREKAQEMGKPFAGHSHNDYWQAQPFYTAYYAGMESIEADVYVRNKDLMVAHDVHEIKSENSLRLLYLEPIARLYKQNQGHAFVDHSKHLQLLVDVKEKYQETLPILIKQLEEYGDIFNPVVNPNAIRVIVTGGRPEPSGFKSYPEWLLFDGDINWTYDRESLRQTGLISADLSDYTDWNGKGLPTNLPKIKQAIAKADSLGLAFRFYGTHDSPNSWQQLINMGVYWINTDHPKTLELFMEQHARSTYQLDHAQAVYQPSFKYDAKDIPAKRILLLIGDGMGTAVVKATLLANRGELSMTQIRSIGLMQTEALDTDNTDSAAGGSAIAVGKKVKNRAIAVDTLGNMLPSIADVLAKKGWNTGVLSVGDVTDATPAVFYGHHQERNESEAILGDFAGSSMSFIMGGKPEWLKDRTDWKGYPGVKVVDGKLDPQAKKQIVFLSDDQIKPVKDGRGAVLKESVLDAMSYLGTGKKSYFMMAESAQIDYAGHANDLKYAITETLDFDATIAEVLKLADQDPEMLVIITADHETGGITLMDSDHKKGRVFVNFSSNDHTNAFVPVFAYGARSYLFQGVYDNTKIFEKILKAVK